MWTQSVRTLPSISKWSSLVHYIHFIGTVYDTDSAISIRPIGHSKELTSYPAKSEGIVETNLIKHMKSIVDYTVYTVDLA